MTEPSSAHDLQCTDILLHLAEGKAGDSARCSPASDLNPADDLVAMDLTAVKTLLAEKERALHLEQRRVQKLQEQLQEYSAEADRLRRQLASSDASAGKKSESNPFDIMLTLSSEREAALRERKLYKDRAAKAEEQVAQLESDLAAAHATAKLQTERANKLAVRHEELQHRVTVLEGEKLIHTRRIAELDAQLSSHHAADKGIDAVTTLRQQLQAREQRIVELERQVSDQLGAPTMFGGEIERHIATTLPAAIHALESLDTPGVVYQLARSINTIGRSKHNDIAIDSPSISRFHARLLHKTDGVWLVDLQSINGCRVNEQRVASQLLKEGDLVVIGDFRFRFSTLSACQPASLLAKSQTTSSL